MNFTHQNNLRLLARNEGKIKSYESCCDVRAWSHDVRTKDRYLREWMKTDMPICVIPVSTLAGLLKVMTCRSRRRATPRCHPGCKTKVLLESICSSCSAVKDCFMQDENFETYFVEEELETSHWPCDKCLEALKSIKMFWKIIIDKIFNLNIAKYEEFAPKCEPTDSVRSVAKLWQAEIMQQALFVKNLTPGLKHRKPNIQISDETSQKTFNGRPIRLLLNENDNKLCRSRSYEMKPQEPSVTRHKKICNCVSKSTSATIHTIDAGCDTCFSEVEIDEIKTYKKHIEVLQNRNHHQIEEVERLKKENHNLKIELESVYMNCPWKASFFSPDCNDIIDTNHNKLSLVPKPFEANIEDNDIHSPKQLESEMIITMKNCKNQSYKHVSLLQVLHKTNEPVMEDLPGCHCKRENPMEILTKVQNTFGAIVRREMGIVNEKKCRQKKSDTDSTFHRINASRSVPSCSTVSSHVTSSSEQDFVSSKD